MDEYLKFNRSSFLLCVFPVFMALLQFLRSFCTSFSAIFLDFHLHLSRPPRLSDGNHPHRSSIRLKVRRHRCWQSLTNARRFDNLSTDDVIATICLSLYSTRLLPQSPHHLSAQLKTLPATSSVNQCSFRASFATASNV